MPRKNCDAFGKMPGGIWENGRETERFQYGIHHLHGAVILQPPADGAAASAVSGSFCTAPYETAASLSCNKNAAAYGASNFAGKGMVHRAARVASLLQLCLYPIPQGAVNDGRMVIAQDDLLLLSVIRLFFVG